ncbi:hypothetical protein CEXT_336591 [Caerostris extrusa]|uniref:Uncharacterized protein n=1 Tax=Caerostris extrusa TaxID=172846 RepID=A0AAV4XYP9_CAEEX|nr:hypothetical protein CEXT_336591 [Caerostris extrusa]
MPHKEPLLCTCPIEMEYFGHCVGSAASVASVSLLMKKSTEMSIFAQLRLAIVVDGRDCREPGKGLPQFTFSAGVAVCGRLASAKERSFVLHFCILLL